MGFLRKLSFWKKSSSSVEPFLPQESPPKEKVKTSPKASLKYLPTPEETQATSAEESPKNSAPGISPKISPSSRPSPSLRAAASPESACYADTKDSPAEAPVATPKEEKVEEKAEEQAEEQKIEVTDVPSPIDFGLPLTEIYTGIGEEFGQMIATSLQSTKWDKRSHALKSIAATLKGLDLEGMAAPGSTGVLGRGLRLRDRTRCWRLSCQLLNHMMRDKVIPVRLAALDLFIDTFSNIDGSTQKSEVQFAAGTLIEHLLDRLGDSNLRLHENARKCVLFTAERPGLLGLGGVLNRLRARLDVAPKGGERPKVIFGVLDAVSVLIEHFPRRRSLDQAIDLDDDLDEPQQIQTVADSWTVDNITCFVVAGMEDSLGSRVRNTAVALAGTVYRSFGDQAAEPLLKGLRPAKQTLLKQKFKDMEEECHEEGPEDGEEGDARPDLDDMMICGSALKPSTQPSSSLQLPGATLGVDEEFMDGILEETGMVFNGGGLNVAGVQQFLGTTDFEDLSIEDQFLLEQELVGLGLEFDELDEQQALMNELFSDMHHSTMASCPVNVF